MKGVITTLIESSIGRDVIGGPHDGLRLDVSESFEHGFGKEGDVVSILGAVYTYVWWPLYDEYGYDVGAQKALAYPGVRVPVLGDGRRSFLRNLSSRTAA
jgi:hypothetical protein